MPVQMRGGKSYATVNERLADAHGGTIRPVGIQEITTEVVALASSTRPVVVIRARVVFSDGRIFTGISEAPFDATSGAEKTNPIEVAECVPLSAQALTLRGWRRYDELVQGEPILAYDAGTDSCWWTPLQRVSVFPAKAMFRLTNARGTFAMDCTADHTWAVFRRPGPDERPRLRRQLREAQRFATSDNLILAAKAPDGASVLSEADAAVIGWLFTDGVVRHPTPTQIRAAITQSKPHTVAVLRALVGDVAKERVYDNGSRTFPTGRTYETRPVHEFSLPAAYLRELFARAEIVGADDLPALALRLSSPARLAMLTAMMQADGSTRGVFGKGKAVVMETFRLLATLEGFALGKPGMSGDGAIPVQKLKQRRSLSCSQLTLTQIGVQPCWCPTTALGTWVMRQGNWIAITGNTSAVGRALAMAGYFGSDDGLAGAEEVQQAQRLAHAERQQQQATNGKAPAAQETTRQWYDRVAPTARKRGIAAPELTLDAPDEFVLEKAQWLKGELRKVAAK